MSRVTKIKHLKRECDSDNFEPPTSNQKIVRIKKSAGNNLHEVEDPEASDDYLVSMPMKFRKSVWMKRGDYVLVEMIVEGEKVKAEIVRILTSDHIKEFSRRGVWPKSFLNKRSHVEEDNDVDGMEAANPNRRTQPNSKIDEPSESSDTE